MQFYSVQLREKIDIDDSQITVITMKNGKKAAQAETEIEGKKIKLFKILSKDDAARLAI